MECNFCILGSRDSSRRTRDSSGTFPTSDSVDGGNVEKERTILEPEYSMRRTGRDQECRRLLVSTNYFSLCVCSLTKHLRIIRDPAILRQLWDDDSKRRDWMVVIGPAVSTH